MNNASEGKRRWRDGCRRSINPEDPLSSDVASPGGRGAQLGGAVEEDPWSPYWPRLAVANPSRGCDRGGGFGACLLVSLGGGLAVLPAERKPGSNSYLGVKD